jgi:hypothetical protein
MNYCEMTNKPFIIDLLQHVINICDVWRPDFIHLTLIWLIIFSEDSTNIIEFVWKNEGRNFIRNLEKKIIKIGVEIQNFGPWSNYFENGKSYYESVGILEDKTFSAESNGK